MASSEQLTDTSAAVRVELNRRVSATFEAAWPAVYRALTRMARAQWELAPLGAAPRRRWSLTTTPRLLAPPDPTPLDLALGTASACIHVSVQCRVRKTIEAWTLTFRAYPDRDEAQLMGASTLTSADTSLPAVQAMLRKAKQEGPGRYPLTPESLPAHPRRARKREEA